MMGQLVSQGFSALHLGLSVCVLSQKYTSITASCLENVAMVVLFYTLSAKNSEATPEDLARGDDTEGIQRYDVSFERPPVHTSGAHE